MNLESAVREWMDDDPTMQALFGNSEIENDRFIQLAGRMRQAKERATQLALLADSDADEIGFEVVTEMIRVAENAFMKLSQAMRLAQAAVSESISWIPCEQRMPDADLVVLVYMPEGSEPVWFGFHDDEDRCWRWQHGLRIAERVSHWAELPGVPS